MVWATEAAAQLCRTEKFTARQIGRVHPKNIIDYPCLTELDDATTSQLPRLCGAFIVHTAGCEMLSWVERDLVTGLGKHGLHVKLFSVNLEEG